VAAVQYTFTHKQYIEQQINNFGWKASWDPNPEWSNKLTMN